MIEFLFKTRHHQTKERKETKRMERTEREKGFFYTFDSAKDGLGVGFMATEYQNTRN